MAARMSNAALRAGLLFGLVLACLSLFAATAQAKDPLVTKVEAAIATAQPGENVDFDGGMYDAATGDVYVDGDPTIKRLIDRKLVNAPGSKPAGEVTAQNIWCNRDYTHCEKITCASTRFYLNYVGDDFRDPYGSTRYYNEYAEIRDDPYRRYGLRGVRGMHEGKWGFYSMNCLTGPLS